MSVEAKMVKKISITISDHVFDTYLGDIKGNRSRYIEKLIYLGGESLIGETENNKARLIKSYETITNLNQEIKNLKLQLGKCEKQLKKPKDPYDDPNSEESKWVKIAKGIKNAGLGAGR